LNSISKPLTIETRRIGSLDSIDTLAIHIKNRKTVDITTTKKAWVGGQKQNQTIKMTLTFDQNNNAESI